MKRYWSWPITLDLFLGGVGGGTLFIAMVLTLIFGEVGSAFALAAFVSAAALAIACFFLVFELGQPQVFWRVFWSATAVIKWGAILLSLALIFGFVYFLTFVPWDFLAFLIPLRMFCLIVAGVSGFLVTIYTGVLLASMKPHAFWNTPTLPILFLVSGVAIGAAVCMLCMGVWPAATSLAELFTQVALFSVLRYVALALTALTGIMLLINLLMVRSSSNKTGREITKRWTSGSYALLFWLVIVVLGCLVPIALFAADGYAAAIVGSVLLLVTGLILRFMIVFSDGRRLMPGEKRFYDRLPHHDAQFLEAWKNKENMY